MAIKVKKKGDSPSEPEIVDESKPEVPNVHLGAYSTSSSGGNWVEDNAPKLLAGIVALVVGIMGVYMAMQYVEGQKIEASTTLSPAYKAYAGIVEGTPEFEEIQNNEELPTPSSVFPSEQARWESILESSEAALSKHSGTELERAARLTKAAALQKLGRVDEAIPLYQEVLKDSPKLSEAVATHQGLAAAYSTQEKWTEVHTSLDALAELKPELSSELRYQRARIFEREGNVEEAKELYHAILEDDKAHPQRADIERRLATL